MTWSIHPPQNEGTILSEHLSASALPSQASSESSLQDSVISWLSNIEDLRPPRSLKRKRSTSSLPIISKPLLADEGSVSDVMPPPSPSATTVTTDPFTPTSNARSQRSPAKPSTANHPWIRNRFDTHGLKYNKQDALVRCPEVKKRVEDILGWEPSAPTNDDSVIAYKFKLETYRTSNERTWLRHLLPLIIKDSYRIQVPGDKDSSSAKTYTTRQWHECGLIATTESDFRRTMIPDKFAQLQIDEILAKALRKDEGMTNPRPDECHGLSPDVLALPTDPVWTPETMALLEASPLMHHPFFVVEGKGPAGNSIDSENQAEWDCATLIYNARFLRSDMGEADVNGADLRTMVFSMTFGIDVCKIWVHWAEVTPFGVSIHMTKVRSMNLDDNDVLERARGCANSILHWGLIDRLPDLKEFHKKLCAYEPKHWKAKQAQHDHNKKKRGSPSKQQ